ncbi:hypothetical protein ACW95P_01900, partial [Candidatus Mycoplasma pogonae]
VGNSITKIRAALSALDGKEIEPELPSISLSSGGSTIADEPITTLPETVIPITAIPVDFSKEFNNLKNEIDNYLSVQQTPTYLDATNKTNQDLFVLNSINEILKNNKRNIGGSILLSDLKDDLEKINIEKTIQKIKQAITNLDGKKVVEQKKQELLSKIDYGIYASLSSAQKQTYKNQISFIDVNQSDWKSRLIEIENYIAEILN